jgi:flotillin
VTQDPEQQRAESEARGAELREELAITDLRRAEEEEAKAEQAIAEAQNTLALRKAALQLDTDKASAEAAAAKPLAEAKAQQNIVQEQELTAKRRASLRKAELDSEVNAVADADAYRVKVAAAAAAEAAVTAANADRDSRVATAEAIRAEGQAEADAILAKGTAEAEATRLSAEALAQQSEAFLQLRMVEMLPQIAHELAAPMGNIDQLTVISTDGAGQLAKNVASGFTEVDAVLTSTMGMGIKDLLGGLVGGSLSGHAAGSAAAAAMQGEGRATQVLPGHELPEHAAEPVLTE